MKIEDALKTSNFRDDYHKSILSLLYTAYWINDNVTQTVKTFGITIEQFNVLRILRGSLPKSLCVREIKERMIEKSSNVPRILDRLERKNFIIRKQSAIDKRETDIFISENALTLLSSMDKIMATTERNLLNITLDEVTFLIDILEKIRNNEQ